MDLEILGICLYVTGMLLLGSHVAKRIKTDEDYFLAGRSLGPTLATFSIFATWFGAETCIGTAGAVYENGLTTIHADPLGYTLCLGLMGLFFAKVLWRKKITTIPDLLRVRFSPTTEKIGALIMIPSSIIWAGAQIRALGQVLLSLTSLSPEFCVGLAALVVIVYTMSGGLLADAYADFIQGIAIIGGLIFLTVVLIMNSGGLSAFTQIPAQKFIFSAPGSFISRLELWMVPILGSLMSQELVSRVVASRSEEVAFRSSFRAAGLYFFIGCLPVIIGLLSVNHLPGLKDAETLMPALARMHLNSFFYVLFVGALVSAILSTVDTTLLASSALFSSNLVYPFLNEKNPRRKVLIARGGTLASGVLAYLIAHSSESITGLVETAASLGGPSILIITIMALWEKRGSALSANLSLVSSVLIWALAHFVWEIDYPILLTVTFCVLIYLGTLPFLEKEKAEFSAELG
jgi:SSS family solute:Na+ symporter